jgi:hypothetical protein
MMVKDSEAILLDYLATLVAMDCVVYHNPRASADELGRNSRAHAGARATSHPTPVMRYASALAQWWDTPSAKEGE